MYIHKYGYIYIYIIYYIYIHNYFFLLLFLVTPDIPLVSGNNNAIKRLSSVRCFSSKKLQEGPNPYEKLSITYFIATGIKTDKDNCVYLRLLPK